MKCLEIGLKKKHINDLVSYYDQKHKIIKLEGKQLKEANSNKMDIDDEDKLDNKIYELNQKLNKEFTCTQQNQYDILINKIMKKQCINNQTRKSKRIKPKVLANLNESIQYDNDSTQLEKFEAIIKDNINPTVLSNPES